MEKESNIVIQGRFVDAVKEFYGQVVVSDGIITDVITKHSDFRKPDAEYNPNNIIFPGFVDLHVHSREDPKGAEQHKEDLSTIAAAAINGGVVAVMDMPNTKHAITTMADLELKQKKAKELPIDFHFYLGIGPETKPANHRFYKVFMAKSVGELYFRNFESLDAKMALYKKGIFSEPKVVSFHCEDPAMIEQDPERPEISELSAINKALDIIKKYQLVGNICHVSTRIGLQAIINSGLRVTCEVTPHHLLFDESNFRNYKMSDFITMNPPIRTKEDREFLLQALINSQIDLLASDHAPHLLEEKEKGIRGVPNLDTYGLFVTYLMQKMNPHNIARITSYNPGKFLGEAYGLIEKNGIGSFTVINPNNPTRVMHELLKTKCSWSPYEDVVFPGKVEATIVRGRLYNIT